MEVGNIEFSFGVSPAFYISLHSNQFTVDNVCRSLSEIADSGFTYYQPEVYFEDNLKSWIDHAVEVQKVADALGLKASQFVAHFMMHYFSREQLLSDKGLQEIECVIESTKQFTECHQITVPIAPYEQIQNLSEQDKAELKKRLIEKLYLILQKVERENLKMALEILPGALITIGEDFGLICEQFNSEFIGLNLDTGHANASGENVAQLPLQYGNRIFGTHLCDNFAVRNDSLRPGLGSVQWELLMRNLITSGYTGSLDIEIHCHPDSVQHEYQAGKQYLETIIANLTQKENIK